MLSELRRLMIENNIDWFIVFSQDMHLSEYTSECDRYLAALTGFTGSAGTLVAGCDEAYLWTDSRYYVQAEGQLKGSGISLKKYGLPKVESVEDFISTHVWEGQRIAFDHSTISFDHYKELSRRLPKSVEIVDDAGILKGSITDMPKRSFNEIVSVPDERSGKYTGDKIKKLRERIRKNYIPEDSYTYILSDLTSILLLFE